MRVWGGRWCVVVWGDQRDLVKYCMQAAWGERGQAGAELAQVLLTSASSRLHFDICLLGRERQLPAHLTWTDSCRTPAEMWSRGRQPSLLLLLLLLCHLTVPAQAAGNTIRWKNSFINWDEVRSRIQEYIGNILDLFCQFNIFSNEKRQKNFWNFNIKMLHIDTKVGQFRYFHKIQIEKKDFYYVWNFDFARL